MVRGITISMGTSQGVELGGGGGICLLLSVTSPFKLGLWGHLTHKHSISNGCVPKSWLVNRRLNRQSFAQFEVLNYDSTCHVNIATCIEFKVSVT